MNWHFWEVKGDIDLRASALATSPLLWIGHFWMFQTKIKFQKFFYGLFFPMGKISWPLKKKKKRQKKKKRKRKKKKKSLEEFSIYIWCCMTRIIPIALCPELYCKKFLILATVFSHFPPSFPVHFHILRMYYNHSQKLWHKPPSLSFNVDFLSFRPARCTRQPSEQFQTIFTLSQHWIGGRAAGGCKHIF